MGICVDGAGAYRIRDAIGESSEVNSVFGHSPFGAKGEYQGQGRVAGVGVVVGQRNVRDRIEWRRFRSHGAVCFVSLGSTCP